MFADDRPLYVYVNIHLKKKLFPATTVIYNITKQ